MINLAHARTEINIHQTSHKVLQVVCVRLLTQANEGAVAEASEATCIEYICTAAVIIGYCNAGNFAGTIFHKSAKDPF